MLQMAIRGAASAFVALGLSIALRFLLPRGPARRDALPIGLLIGFLVGYILLPDWAPLQPQRYWQWIPYLAVIAGFMGPTYLASGVHPLERAILQIVFCGLAAYLLTPTWAELDPPRQLMIPLLGGYLFVLCVLTEPLGARLPPFWFMTILSAVALAATGLVSYACSLKMGEILLVGTGALFGCTLACMFIQTFDGRGVVLAFTIIVAGLTFAAHVEPREAPRALLLIPAAPVALWIAEIPAIARANPATRVAVQTTAVTIFLALATALLFWTLKS